MLVVCWLCEAVLWVVPFRCGDGVVSPAVERVHSPMSAAVTQEGTGVCHMRRWDAANGCRPVINVGWRNLRAENGRLGIFKTPLQKTITIEHLAIDFYRYSHENDSEDVWRLPADMVGVPSETEACDVAAVTADVVGGAVCETDARGTPVAARGQPVHRFWSPVLASHFYTLDETERAALLRNWPDIWTYEGVFFHAYPVGLQPEGTVPVYRFWSGLRRRHFYTTSECDKNRLIEDHSNVWAYEGIAWYQERDGLPVAVDSSAIGEESPGSADRFGLAEGQDHLAKLMQAVGELGSQFAGEDKRLTIGGPLGEANRATRVIVQSLKYRLFRDNRLQLSVQCRYAVASTSGTEILLRGGVAVCAANGNRLISNSMVWDVEKDRFSVPGTYVLDREGVPIRGRGFLCDHRLNVALTQDRYSKEGENRWTGKTSFWR